MIAYSLADLIWFSAQFTVDIVGTGQQFWFQAKTDAECKVWRDLIQWHITESEGFRYSLPAPVAKEFWKQEQISERQFIALADIFDILLFSTNTIASSITRAYTQCEFGKYDFAQY